MQSFHEGGVAIAQMVNFARRLERNSYGWRVVHLHLSRLRAPNRRDFQIRIAANEFEPLLRSTRGDLFQLGNGDLVYFWQGEGMAEVDKVLLKLRYLFSDDPLVSGAEGNLDETEQDETPAGDQPSFCTWHDLEVGYDDFREQIERLLHDQTGRRAAGQGAASKPLDPAMLARVEQTLANADVSSLLRRQPICALLPGHPPRPIFHETHLAIGEMAKRLVPGVDLTADPWLFQRLAETLDRRLLHCLIQQGRSECGAFSVNLRLATLLSPDFLKFDEQFRRPDRDERSEMVIELQLVDIYAELGAYLFMRDFVRERGYRICVDGLHYLHMPLINRKRLGADLVKLIWNPDLLGETSEQRLAELRTAIKAAGIDRIILCRCDSAQAISWGQAQGIRMFQGHYLDSRLRAVRAPAVSAARTAMRAQR